MDEQKEIHARRMAGVGPGDSPRGSDDVNAPAVSPTVGETVLPSGSAVPETPLAHTVVRGGFWVTMTSYLNIGFGFLANLFLTRILAPEHFGVFALATFFFSFLNLRPKLGSAYAFAQHESVDGDALGSYLSIEFTSSLLSLLIAGAAVPVLLAFGYSNDVAWVVVVLAIVGVSDSLMSVAGVLLDKALYFKWPSLFTTLVFPLSYLPAFWLALHGGGYWSLVAQNATYSFCLLLGYWWLVHRQLSSIYKIKWRWNGQVAGKLLRFGLVVGLGLMAGSMFGQFDNFLVGTFVGLATLGFYDRAYRIAQWPSLLLFQVSHRTAFYTYARLRDDPVRLRKTVIMVLWLISTLGLALALAVFTAAPDLINLLYGERWLPSALFLRFLVIYAFLGPLADVASSLLIAVGQPQRWTRVLIVQTTVLVLVATPLTLFYGAVGTCIGVGISQIVGLVLIYRQVNQTVRLPFLDVLGAPVAAVLVAALGYFVLTSTIDLSGMGLLLRIVVESGVAGVIFFAVLLLLQQRRMIERAGYIWKLLRGTAVGYEV